MRNLYVEIIGEIRQLKMFDVHALFWIFVAGLMFGHALTLGW